MCIRAYMYRYVYMYTHIYIHTYVHMYRYTPTNVRPDRYLGNLSHGCSCFCRMPADRLHKMSLPVLFGRLSEALRMCTPVYIYSCTHICTYTYVYMEVRIHVYVSRCTHVHLCTILCMPNRAQRRKATWTGDVDLGPSTQTYCGNTGRSGGFRLTVWTDRI